MRDLDPTSTASSTILVALLLAAPLAAQAPPIGASVPTWQPNGFVNAVIIDGDTLYAGGLFDQVGPRTGTFAVIDPADPTAVTSGAVDDVASDVVVADGAGGWFVATGRGAYVGASESGRILHVLADGSRDPAWSPVVLDFGAAYTLAVDAGRLFMAGTFGVVNGQIRLGVAALDAATGTVLPWNAQIGGDGLSVWVFHLAVAANRVVVAGSFSAVAGVPRNRVAILDATTGALLPGTLSSTLVAPVIRSVTASATRIYLEGDCQAGGNAFCGYDLHLTPLPGWTFPRSAGPIVASANGVFATTSGTSTSARLRVVKLDPDTGAPLAWSGLDLAGGTPSTHAAEPAMQVVGGTLYLGGDFTTVNGTTRQRVAAVDATSGAVLPWAPVVGGRVRSLAATAGGVAIAGDFTSVGGVRRQNLVAIDLRSGRPLPNTPAVDLLQVTALLKLGDVMVVGGMRRFFTSSPDVLAFSTTTGLPIAWSLSSDGQVWALAAGGRSLYVGGWFSSLAGQRRLNLGSVDLGTGALTPWNPSPDGQVTTLTVSEGALYAAGFFNSLPGYGRPGAAAFDAATGAVLSFNPDLGAPGLVHGFAFSGDRVLLGGEPDGINRGAFRWVARGSGATIAFSSPTRPGAKATRLAQAGDAIYAVANTTVEPGLASIDPVSGRVAGWHNPLGISTTAFAASRDYVVIGGGPGIFSVLGASLAVYDAPRAGAPRSMTANVTGAAVTLGWQPGALPAASAYLVEAGTTPGGTEVGVFDVGPATAVAGTLPPGTYFTRVRGSQAGRPGAASSEVIVTVPAPPGPPGAPGTLSATVSAGVVILRWGAARGNAATYVVEAGTATGLSNIVVAPTGHLDTTLATPAPAGTYFVRVRAANAFGLGPPSNEVTVVVPAIDEARRTANRPVL